MYITYKTNTFETCVRARVYTHTYTLHVIHVYISENNKGRAAEERWTDAGSIKLTAAVSVVFN